MFSGDNEERPYPYQNIETPQPPTLQPNNGESPETKKIYNELRLWGGTALFVITLGLALFDVVDDIALGNQYAGAPTWLTAAFTGVLAALFGPLVLQGISKGVSTIWKK